MRDNIRTMGGAFNTVKCIFSILRDNVSTMEIEAQTLLKHSSFIKITDQDQCLFSLCVLREGKINEFMQQVARVTEGALLLRLSAGCIMEEVS